MPSVSTAVDRRRLLQWAGAAALAAPLAPVAARAAVPKPAPQSDGAGFLAFLAPAEAVVADLYHGARRLTGRFDATERRRLTRLEVAKREAILRVTGPLGDDAPQAGDFAASFPAGDVATRPRLLALAEKLERLICGVELNGVGYAADPATRILLGRLLVADTQALSTVRAIAGKPAMTGLLAPVDVEAAGAILDGYLTSPTAPKEGVA